MSSSEEEKFEIFCRHLDKNATPQLPMVKKLNVDVKDTGLQHQSVKRRYSLTITK